MKNILNFKVYIILVLCIILLIIGLFWQRKAYQKQKNNAITWQNNYNAATDSLKYIIYLGDSIAHTGQIIMTLEQTLQTKNKEIQDLIAKSDYMNKEKIKMQSMLSATLVINGSLKKQLDTTNNVFFKNCLEDTLKINLSDSLNNISIQITPDFLVSALSSSIVPLYGFGYTKKETIKAGWWQKSLIGKWLSRKTWKPYFDLRTTNKSCTIKNLLNISVQDQ